MKELKVYKPQDYFKKDIHKEDESGVKRKNKAEYESKEERFERKLIEEQAFLEVPRGPLGGGTYAVSGQFRDITREKIEEFIKKNGGNMVALVNKKTDYLIVGHILDDGR